MRIPDLITSFASWLGTSTRAVLDGFKPRKKGLGERVFARASGPGGSVGFSGGMFSDRYTQVQAFRHWVFIAIRAICKEISQHPPNIALVRPGPMSLREKAWRDPFLLRRQTHSLKSIQPHEEVEPVGDDHPCRRLFAVPNAQDMSSDLIYQLVMFLELTGEAYLWAIPSQYGQISGRGEPAEIWTCPSHWVWPRIRDKNDTAKDGAQGLVKDYEIRPFIGGSPWHIPASEIIPFRYPSPLHMIRGWSPAQAGSEWIDGTSNTLKAAYWTMQNGCFPNGALESDGQFYNDPDDAMLERVSAKFFARYQGPTKTGLPMILPPGMKFTPLTVGATEFPFVQSAEAFRDNTLALYDVSKSVVGIEPSGDNISWYAALKAFFRICIMPRTAYLGQVFTRHLANRWDPQLRIWWDDPTPEDPAQLNADMQADSTCFVTTINERRAQRSLPPKKGYDFIPGPMGIGEISADSGESPYDLGSLGKPDGEEEGTKEDEALKPVDNKPGSVGDDKALPAWVNRIAGLPRRKALADSFPQVMQDENYSCGAACFRAVCMYYGVGPDNEDEAIALLGTDPQEGTRVAAIVKAAQDLGLTATATQMTLDELAAHTAKDVPVICCTQQSGTGERSGHYVTAIAVTDTSVIVQDPAEGPKRIGKKLWETRWHDKDGDGKEYEHFGIVIAKGAAKNGRLHVSKAHG